MFKVHERAKQRQFLDELAEVSLSLFLWAQGKFAVDDWTVDDVKSHIRAAMDVCQRDK